MTEALLYYLLIPMLSEVEWKQSILSAEPLGWDASTPNEPLRDLILG